LAFILDVTKKETNDAKRAGITRNTEILAEEMSSTSTLLNEEHY